MKEIFGNAWDLYLNYTYLAITTNGFVKMNGEAVMGRGIALQIKLRYPDMPMILGYLIKTNGNIVQHLVSNFISFPVKHKWFEVADIELIKRSCKQLMELLQPNETCLLPRPGCGNGKLDWSYVKPIIQDLLDDRVTIVHFEDSHRG